MEQLAMFYSRPVTELRSGINIFGYVFAEHGVGEEARLLVQIAKQAKLEFAVVPYTETFSRQAVPFDDLGTGEAAYDVNLICVNADALPHFVEHFGSAILAGRYNIGLWAWEVAELPGEMTRSAQFLDEIWACSSFTADAIARSVPLPVFSLPPPILISEPPAVRRQDLGLSEKEFLFLFCFDFNSVFERKNVLATIAAFKLAFPPGHGAQLLVKTINGNDFQAQMMQLNAAAADHPDIIVIDGYLQPSEQLGLLNACDAYISLHRAEGFGFTLAEAMALGKPVIATGYSGNLDFMTEENSYLVPHKLVRIPAGCAPYPPTAFWAEPDIKQAASLMRLAFDRREEAHEKGKRAQEDIAKWHGPRARAKFVSERIGIIHQWSTSTRRSAAEYTVIGYDPRAVERGLSIRNDLEESRKQHAHRPFRAFAAGKHALGAQLAQLRAENVVANLFCGALDGVRLDHHGNAVVWGWAYDPSTNRPARSVILVVNEQPPPMGAVLGCHRPDVAAHLDNPGLATAGWMISLPAPFLSPGRNVIEAYALLDDGRFGKLAESGPGRGLLFFSESEIRWGGF
jgi:glycosyltransferase involved in cell wall biosynthesis